MHHPHCYLDIIYLHLRANEENARCQEIFDRLSRLVHNAHPFGEREQYSNLEPFVLETHASAIKLGSHMAALLAHPAQREEVQHIRIPILFYSLSLTSASPKLLH